jgi:hypothetical protein
MAASAIAVTRMCFEADTIKTIQRPQENTGDRSIEAVTIIGLRYCGRMVGDASLCRFFACRFAHRLPRR